jgi:hypothetical protein
MTVLHSISIVNKGKLLGESFNANHKRILTPRMGEAPGNRAFFVH